jgi:hypothetical protein
MRPPPNPGRRNRNIGTARQGHGQDNRMVVPRLSRAQGSLTAVLAPARIEWRGVAGRDLCFVVEETSGGCSHACTVADVVALLRHIPASDWAGLDTFVLRQSTRKSRLLRPAWGRLYYNARLAFRDGSPGRWGPTVFLEAFEVGSSFSWPTSLDPDDAAELEQLRADGHRIEQAGRRYRITSPAEAVRATQLYRTLPHEIGHWFDWLEKVETPAARGEDFAQLEDRFFARSNREREPFAHLYAERVRVGLEADGVIPFDRKLDAGSSPA